MTSLEGCDAIIKDAEKDLKKLDSTSKTYATDMEKLKNTILIARVAKLKLIDRSTLAGLKEAKKLTEDIINALPPGHASIEQYKQQLIDIDRQIADMLKTMSASGDIKSMKEARSHIENIMLELPKGSEQLNEWAKQWREVNRAIEQAEQHIANVKQGIMEGSTADLEQQLKTARKNLEDFRANANIEVMGALNFYNEEEALQQIVDDLEKRVGNSKLLKGGIEVVASKPLDITFNYRMSKTEKIEQMIDFLTKRLEYLKGLKIEDIGEQAFKDAQTEIEKINGAVINLKKNLKVTELTDDIREYKKQLATGGYDLFKNSIGGINQMYEGITGLVDKLDECENAFEGVMAVFETIFTIIDGIKSAYEGVSSLVEIINMLRGAKDALTASTEKNTAVTNVNTATTQENAAAQQMEAGADAQEAAASIGKAAANTAEASSEATSQMSSMGPFGWIAGIAAALAISGALFGIISQAKGFATGGIVKGSTTMGDSVLVRANAGEAILNQRQQSRLFDFIDHGQMYGDAQPQVTSVKVRGSDLYLCLKNYGKSTHKTTFGNGISTH